MHPIPQTLSNVLNGGHSIIAVCRQPSRRHAKYVDLQRLIGRLGGRTPLLPQPELEHYSDLLRCPVCRKRGMFVWFEPKVVVSRPDPLPNYRIIDRGAAYPFNDFNVIAAADNLMVARAGYAAAAMFYSDHNITLQQGIYVIMGSKRDGLPQPLMLHDFKEIRKMEQRLSSGFSDDDPQVQAAEVAKNSKAG